MKEPGRVLRIGLDAALWLVAGAIVTSWLGLVALHLDDDYRVTHSQGVWVAVAEGAREGVLYPPLFDGEHYAGTRYLPLPILLNAAASEVTDDPWVAGKLVAALLMAALLVLMVAVLRHAGCRWPVAAALAAGVVATEAGLQSGTTIGGDLLPVVLQVGALLLASRAIDGRSMALAGGLAGLAAASKLTGLWGALAIMTWLVARRQWRPARIFAGACVGTAAVVLGAVLVVSRGGLATHLMAFAPAGIEGAYGLLRAPNLLLFNLREFATGTVVLFPVAVLGALTAAGWRQLPLVQIALGYALLFLLVVYADVGTGFNQLIDVVALTALAVGCFAGAGRDERQVISLILALSVLWAGSLDLVRTVGRELRLGVAAARRGELAPRSAAVVAGIVAPGEEVLVEDPSIEIAMGRRPRIMDPFMLTRLDRTRPDWVDPLISRIEQRQFQLVVLVVPLENRSLDYWWTDYHLGPRVAAALRRAYRPAGLAGRYFLYRPAT